MHILWLAFLFAAAPGVPMPSPVPPPEPIPASARCVDWTGTASGNDPSVQVQLQLCGAGEAVRGFFQWSSALSGWNRRSVVGTRTASGALTLHDAAMVIDNPQPGWRFCLIDRYDLAPVGDQLTGSYVSAACHDHASVTLHRAR